MPYLQHPILVAAITFALWSGLAHGDGLPGLWVTGPDYKGQVGHVSISPCGGALCGTVTRAFDEAGQPVKTPNVGKRVIWDVTGTGDGRYEGLMHISQLGTTVRGTFELNGPRLKVRGCLGPVCQAQTWTRVE